MGKKKMLTSKNELAVYVMLSQARDLMTRAEVLIANGHNKSDPQHKQLERIKRELDRFRWSMEERFFSKPENRAQEESYPTVLERRARFERD